MGDVKWIKLDTGLPSNKKIKQLRKLPQGDTIALMWVFLMCLAGETNDDGMVYFTREVPYTDEMLADQFDMEINTVRLGLATFQRFGMIEIVEDIMCLSSWEKWQATDKLSEIREQTRKRVAKHREKQKQIACNVTGNVTVTHCNATEEDIDKDIDKEKDIDNISASDESASVSKKPVKHKYGEYNHVLLTDAEYEKLCKDFGEDTAKRSITYLDEAIEMKGYKYKSHNLAIRKWVIEAVRKEQKTTKNNGYGGQDLSDLDEFFR